MTDLASSSTIAPGAKLVVKVVGSVDELPQVAWDGLDHGASPFLRHGFLHALEASGSIDAPRRGGRLRRKSGWTSVYLLCEIDGRLAGAVAAFIKDHSYGEYIFDWGWANSAQRAGIRYYPKLVIAAPATPATGHRILLAPGLGDAKGLVRSALIAAVRDVADEMSCSSIHWLFCTAEEQAALVEHGLFARASYQFHWNNRGYKSFDDFLGAMTSRKRKQIRKERARVHAAIDNLMWVSGRELDQARLDDLDRFYRSTTDAHGGRDYLRPGFFHRLAESLPDAMQMVEVTVQGKRAAGALFLESPGGLYGRYWGADVEIELLHFETAYYAGIERAIVRGIPLFEAGAQGEHKLLRGFEPSPTYSAHWIRHEALAMAIQDHVRREAVAVAAEIEEIAKFGPFRKHDEVVP
ncbi:MAG: GNAT family N-acetyltransferase [Kofleriaceae bacterium]